MHNSMRLPVTRHEDDRRVLTEYISNIPFKRAKVIESKGKVTLGKHYHKNNDSVFFVLKGKTSYHLKSAHSSTAKESRGWLFEGECLFVPRGIIHTFNLLPSTIMLESATEPYDKEDEISVS